MVAVVAAVVARTMRLPQPLLPVQAAHQILMLPVAAVRPVQTAALVPQAVTEAQEPTEIPSLAAPVAAVVALRLKHRRPEARAASAVVVVAPVAAVVAA